MMGLYSPLDGMQSPFGARRKNLFDRVMDLEPFGMWDFGAAGFQTPGLEPTATGAPVGLGLDLSQGVRLSSDQIYGLGPELWDNAAVQTNGAAEILGNGRFRIYSPNNDYSSIFIPNTLTPGVSYLFSYTIEHVAAGVVRAGNTGINRSSVGVHRELLTPENQSAYMKRQDFSGNGTDIIVSGISIREIPGNHFVTGNIPQSPTLDAAGALDFDGLDDQIAVSVAALTDAHIFLALDTVDSIGILFAPEAAGSGNHLGAWSNSTSDIAGGAGVASVKVDGQPAADRAELRETLLAPGAHFVEVSASNLAGWSELWLSGYAGWRVDGQFSPRIYIHDNANGPLTDHNRALIERWVTEGLS